MLEKKTTSDNQAGEDGVEKACYAACYAIDIVVYATLFELTSFPLLLAEVADVIVRYGVAPPVSIVIAAFRRTYWSPSHCSPR